MMRVRFNKYLWNTLLGPRNKRLFGLRIWLRVRWLFFQRWWQHKDWRSALIYNPRRPLGVLLAFAIPVLIMMWLDIPLGELQCRLRELVKGGEDSDPLSWQIALLLFGAPVAFILWLYRDINAQANLENQRKDINLKEFQEIQMRAAGAMDESLPEKARETLQIAAIHQLRPFLRGEYGASFRRPAWELLKARLAISAGQNGYDNISALTGQDRPLLDTKKLGNDNQAIAVEFRDALAKINPNAVTLAERAIISEESTYIFRKDLPLTQTRLDGMNLSRALIMKANLRDTSFIGANLKAAHLEGASLFWAHLEGANLFGAHLEGAGLFGAHLQGADLIEAHLQGADLRWAYLEGAYLFGAHLEGADLIEAYLEGANLSGAHLDDQTDLEGAIYDDATQFAKDWENLSAEQKDEARAPWRERGMVHIDEVKR